MAEKVVDERSAASFNISTMPAATRKLESSSRVQLCLHDEALCRGTKLHVQTEDLGMEKAQIVTLVFSGGQILFSRKTDYRDILTRNDVQHTVAEQVKAQHLAVLTEIRDGQLDHIVSGGKGL